MEVLGVDREFTRRYLNEGFSGGEKKRCEILQMAILKPFVAVLDETDSGLDIDALRTVANAVNAMRGPDLGALIITHYQRILELHHSPTSSTSCWTGASSRRAAPSWAPSSRSKGYDWVRESTPRRPQRPSRVGMEVTTAQAALPRSVEEIRADFPILAREFEGKPLVYLDNAATLAEAASGDRGDRLLLPQLERQRPPQHARARRRGRPRSTRAAARRSRRSSARAPREIVFVRNATEAINLVRYTWAREHVGRGRRGADHGDGAPLERRPLAAALPGAGRAVRVPARRRRRPPRPRRSSTSSSRAGGCGWSRRPTSPTCSARSTRSRRSSERAHAAGAMVLLDGAQAVPQMPVDVQATGADFYAFTGHKMLGPDRHRRALGAAASCSRRCRRSSAAAR